MGTIPAVELFLAQKGKCFYCGKPFFFIRGTGDSQYTYDHFLPKSKGNGINGNVVLCHAKCNEAKGNRNPTKAEQSRKRALYLKIKNRRIALEAMKKNKDYKYR